MIKILGKLPRTVAVSCSGGPDSMAAVDFLLRSRRNISIIHFDHGTDHGHMASKFIEKFCKDKGLHLTIKKNYRDS